MALKTKPPTTYLRVLRDITITKYVRISSGGDGLSRIVKPEGTKFLYAIFDREEEFKRLKYIVIQPLIE